MPFQYTFRADDLESIKAEDRDLLENRDREVELYLSDLGAHTSFTPTWYGMTIGNATVNAAYSQIGKTVNARVSMIVGSTTSFTSSSIAIACPVTPKSGVTQAGGSGIAIDASTPTYQYFVACYIDDDPSFGYINIRTPQLSTFMELRSTSNSRPFTWATGDTLAFSITYEAA